MSSMQGVKIRGRMQDRFDQILTPEALDFVMALQRKFGPTRTALLQARAERQAAANAGALPDFCPETAHVRSGDWKIAPLPPDLQDRRVEITGPTERKMLINALNSGAKVFMADFEDSLTPSWQNIIEGQINLIDAVAGTISFTNPDGRLYRLGEQVATLIVRPRGWHLIDKNVLVDGQPISGSLLDFGLYLFHNARRLLAKGSGPYFYLPKLESSREARLWNDVFVAAQEWLGLPQGTIKATVLIETVYAAFEMDEILYELREHVAGLNAGRWDYIFTFSKKFQTRPEFVFPDRGQVTMTVPFMRAYTRLLVQTCHRRGAHAMGGMAAFIPSRKDLKVNEMAIAKVREDKLREANDGCDGTWVAHPDLVPVAMECFDSVLGNRPNQVSKQCEELSVTAQQLLDVHIPGATITEAGLRSNVVVSILYIESWLRGIGAAALFNLMEDAATAEISRSQIWQWVRHGASLQDGPKITVDLVRTVAAEELAKVHEAIGDDAYVRGQFDRANSLFEQVTLGETFVDFLTLPAYDMID